MISAQLTGHWEQYIASQLLRCPVGRPFMHKDLIFRVLQSAANIVTKCVSFSLLQSEAKFVTFCDSSFYYKVGQLCYKVRQLLQSGAKIVTK